MCTADSCAPSHGYWELNLCLLKCSKWPSPLSHLSSIYFKIYWNKQFQSLYLNNLYCLSPTYHQTKSLLQLISNYRDLTQIRRISFWWWDSVWRAVAGWQFASLSTYCKILRLTSKRKCGICLSGSGLVPPSDHYFFNLLPEFQIHHSLQKLIITTKIKAKPYFSFEPAFPKGQISKRNGYNRF